MRDGICVDENTGDNISAAPMRKNGNHNVDNHRLICASLMTRLKIILLA
jgi:hypothetical protein